MKPILRIGLGVVRLHYVLLTPLIVFNIPPQALFNLNIPVTFSLAALGIAGNSLAKRKLSILVSITLLYLLVWGRAASDLLGLKPPDSLILIVEFGMVLFLMEANMVSITYGIAHGVFKERSDELSSSLEARLSDWLQNQFSRQAKIALGSLTISLVLLPLAGFTSISSEQLPITGALLLAAIIALLFLIIYGREPEIRKPVRLVSSN